MCTGGGGFGACVHAGVCMQYLKTELYIHVCVYNVYKCACEYVCT